MTTSDRVLGGLWGAMVGDALGVPVESTSRSARRRDPVTGLRGFGTHGQPPGTWSDDSSLLLCTVEALCEAPFQIDRLAELFVAWETQGHWTPHGTVFDIGIATRSAIDRLARGVPPEEAGGVGERDNGNGSLMRILPVALRSADAPVESMLDLAHRVSALTHRHPRSQMACGLYCLMARALREGLPPWEAYQRTIAQGGAYYQTQPFQTERPHFARVFSGSVHELPEADIASGGYVVHSLEAALWCLLTTTDFPAAVLTAVNLGDDTDTTACVAGGLAGLWYGVEGIPEEWREAIVRRDDIRALLDRFTRQ